MKKDGVSIVWLKQNKKLFFFQKFQLTNVKDSTNVLFVVIKFGYKVEDHQLKVFIDKKSDQNVSFCKKIVD